MQKSFAAYERDLAGSHCRELSDDIERLRGRELVVARVAGPRAAVRAALVAAQRELPDDVGGMWSFEDAQPAKDLGHGGSPLVRVPGVAKVGRPVARSGVFPERRSAIGVRSVVVLTRVPEGREPVGIGL